jgi:hypothetical protein
MENHPIEEPPEAIIPMEIVSSGGQSAIEEPEAIIPNETVSSGTGTLCRKVARRTESWYPQLPRRGTRQRQLPTYFASLSPPQAEDIPARARKKRRLEESLPTTRATTTDEAARKTASPDISVGPPPPTADDDIDDDIDGDIDDANTDADFLTDTQMNAGARRCWTLEEDAKLIGAVTNAPKKKHNREYKTDWVAVAALVPGRTGKQCGNRWRDVLNPSIDWALGRTGKWSLDEDDKLKDAVQTHGDKDWVVIATLVPGRTRAQCSRRWKDVLNASVDGTTRRTGKGTGTWSADEDSKLKDSVQMHDGKNWKEIAALVPGRTKEQCKNRWHNVLDPSIDRATGRTGTWSAVEDRKLKDAVRTHGSKNWKEIAALVPGRVEKRCCNRWQFLGRSHKQE